MNQIKVKHSWHPNTSIEFTNSGVWLRVSLNIIPGVGKFLSPNNVQKGKTFYVYALKSFVQSDMINKNTLETIQKMLLTNCMNNIRNAKLKYEETHVTK